jgi:hypothetical protein
MYDTQTYLRDNGDDSTDAIAIIETDLSDGYRVTEKRGGEWCKAFWMPENELHSHDTEVVGTLNSEQYLRLCESIGVA